MVEFYLILVFEGFVNRYCLKKSKPFVDSNKIIKQNVRHIGVNSRLSADSQFRSICDCGVIKQYMPWLRCHKLAALIWICKRVPQFVQLTH